MGIRPHSSVRSIFIFLTIIFQFIVLLNCSVYNLPLNDGDIYKKYCGKVSRKNDTALRFSYERNETEAVQLVVNSSDASNTYPILIVVRRQREVDSYTIPLIVEQQYSYNNLRRTLCPVEAKLKNQTESNQTVFIDITSNAPVNNAPSFCLEAILLKNFALELGEPVDGFVTPSSPQYYQFHFSAKVDSVQIFVESEDNLCLIFSVQNVHCPIFDDVKNVMFSGHHQTVSRKGSITVYKSDYSDTKAFSVVLVLQPTDFKCLESDTIHRPGDIRTKNFTITINETLSRTQYVLPILVPAIFYGTVCLIAFLISGFYHCCNDLQSILGVKGIDELENDMITPSMGPPNAYGSADNSGLPEPHKQMNDVAAEQVGEPGPSDRTSSVPRPPPSDSSSNDSSLSDDIDMLDDASSDKNIYRTNVIVYVSDLARKKSSVLVKKYRLYHWYLIIISIFYGLPVIQLVFNYQRVLHRTGDEDMCYYNFYCARPLSFGNVFEISSFNNVYSNIGYFVLGILFTFLTFRRSLIYKRLCERHPNCKKNFGIPQHFGLFYAMGIGLSMEGVMSACYHICPSYANFQFDTAFMYILAALCMLKLYQIRHPDINASAHAAYMMMAMVILIGVVGVMYSSLAFWIIFTIVYLVLSLFLTAEIYHMGRWKLDLRLPQRVFLTIRNDGWRYFQPIYLDRIIMLAVANICNWTIAIVGITKRPKDFPSYLVAIFMANLFMYFLFYVIMKLRSRERLLCIPVLYMLLAGLCGSSAVYFFTQLSSSWEMTPAQSRALNSNCILFDFYDTHDVWHFLSALGMFFSFMMILNFDDDLIGKRRDRIPVF